MVHDTGVSVSFVYPIIRNLMDKGLETEFFRRSGLDERLLQDREARLPGEQFERLTELASELTADPLYGLHLGQKLEISDLGILGYVMLHSQTLGRSLEAYQKYNIIVCSSFQVSWQREGEDLWLSLTIDGPPRQQSRHCIEEMAASLFIIMRKLSCRSFPLKEVQFMHAPGPAGISGYEQGFGLLPRFNQAANRLRVNAEVLDYPILLADKKLLGTFEGIAEQAKQHLTRGSTFSNQLYSWLINHMPASPPDLHKLAAAFHMSPRSLQARLKLENTSFQEMLNLVRQELAQRYLQQPDYTVSEVAYLLHYAEPSAFQNAFKKWTGLTPGQYRSQRLTI